MHRGIRRIWVLEVWGKCKRAWMELNKNIIHTIRHGDWGACEIIKIPSGAATET